MGKAAKANAKPRRSREQLDLELLDIEARRYDPAAQPAIDAPAALPPNQPAAKRTQAQNPRSRGRSDFTTSGSRARSNSNSNINNNGNSNNNNNNSNNNNSDRGINNNKRRNDTQLRTGRNTRDPNRRNGSANQSRSLDTRRSGSDFTTSSFRQKHNSRLGERRDDSLSRNSSPSKGDLEIVGSSSSDFRTASSQLDARGSSSAIATTTRTTNTADSPGFETAGYRARGKQGDNPAIARNSRNKSDIRLHTNSLESRRDDISAEHIRVIVKNDTGKRKQPSSPPSPSRLRKQPKRAQVTPPKQAKRKTVVSPQDVKFVEPVRKDGEFFVPSVQKLMLSLSTLREGKETPLFNRGTLYSTSVQVENLTDEYQVLTDVQFVLDPKRKVCTDLFILSTNRHPAARSTLILICIKAWTPLKESNYLPAPPTRSASRYSVHLLVSITPANLSCGASPPGFFKRALIFTFDNSQKNIIRNVVFRVCDADEPADAMADVAPAEPFRYEIPRLVAHPPGSLVISRTASGSSLDMDSGTPLPLPRMQFQYAMPAYIGSDDDRITRVWEDALLMGSAYSSDFCGVAIQPGNIAARFHDLLYLEEKQMRIDIRNYEIYGVRVCACVADLCVVGGGYQGWIAVVSSYCAWTGRVAAGACCRGQDIPGVWVVSVPGLLISGLTNNARAGHHSQG